MCYQSRYRPVYLIGKPILAGYALKLKYLLKIREEFVGKRRKRLKFIIFGNILHIGLRGATKHICHLQVYCSLTGLLVFKGEIMLSCSLSNHIHWGTFSVCNCFKFSNILLIHHQSHTLLALISYNLLKT